MTDSSRVAVHVDGERCVGSGECVLAAPSVFDFRGVTATVVGDPQTLSAVELQVIAESCPSGAIAVTPRDSQ